MGVYGTYEAKATGRALIAVFLRNRGRTVAP